MSKAKLPKRGPKRQGETAVKTAVMDYLAMRGIMAWVNPRGGVSRTYTRKSDGVTNSYFMRFGGLPGASDIFAILGPTGRFLAIETKRVGEKPTTQQTAFLQSVEAAGGLGIVAWTL